jgi:hypothetical protein
MLFIVALRAGSSSWRRRRTVQHENHRMKTENLFQMKMQREAKAKRRAVSIKAAATDIVPPRHLLGLAFNVATAPEGVLAGQQASSVIHWSRCRPRQHRRGTPLSQPV